MSRRLSKSERLWYFSVRLYRHREKAKINFVFFACRVDMRKVTAYNAVKRKIIFVIKKIKFRNSLKSSAAHSCEFRVV